MEYPVELIRQACLEPDQVPEILERFPLGIPLSFPKRVELFRAFLKNLPSPNDQTRILERLQTIAATNGTKLDDLKWWDVPHCYLFGQLTREERVFRVGFSWKATLKGTQPMLNQSSCYWVPDKEAPGGYFIFIEAYSYQEVKALFNRWLTTPLVLHPNFRS